MKKLKIIFTILILIVIGFFAVKFILGIVEDARVKKIKEGWHIEVVNEYIKIRKEPDKNSSELGQVKRVKFIKWMTMKIIAEIIGITLNTKKINGDGLQIPLVMSI